MKKVSFSGLSKNRHFVYAKKFIAKNRAVSFGILFGVVGSLALLATYAADGPAGSAVSVEPETGVLSNNATTVNAKVVTNSSASGGQAIKFGGNNPVIPDTNYAIPAGAVFVAPGGNDASAGNQANPVATLASAYSKVASGGTIVLRAGVYHEGELTFNRQITIQPYPHEQAWLDGTTVQNSGWVSDTGNWRLDNSPSSNLCKSSCVQDSSQIDPSYPMAGSPQMVFRDGNPLTEVGSKAAATSGKFFFDTATNALYLGDDPAGHTIEITTKRRAFLINTDGTIIRGIGIRRYGSILNPTVSPFHFAQAMTNTGVDNVTFEKNLFWQSASRGLYIGNSSGAIVRGNVFQANGMNGVDMTNVTSPLFEQNQVLSNNGEHFSTAPGATAVIAGSKIVTSTGGTVRDNIFDGNGGNGWWCDINCTGFTVVRNIFRNNTRNGLFYEVSGTGLFASNLAYSNGNNGFQIIGQSNRIYNNTFSNNLQNLAIWEDTERTGGNNDTRSTTVKNNIFSNATGGSTNSINQPVKLFDIYGFNKPDSVSPSLMVTAMDYNAYYRSNANTPANVLGWMGTTVSQNFTAFGASLKTTTGRETNGIGSDGGINPYFVNEAGGDYHIKTGSPALNAGEALPADVAAAIGVAASPVNIGILAWPN